MTRGPILLYGATGRTGAQICSLAIERGLPLIVAGRHPGRVKDAAKGQLEARVFGLDTPSTIDACLEGVGAVLHAAGPSPDATFPMVEACLRTGTPYLDLSDSLALITRLRALDAEARLHGTMLLPAVGATTLAADCLALSLAASLDAPTRLDLALFDLPPALAAPAACLAAGLLRPLPPAARTREFSHDGQTRLCAPISGVELLSLHALTGIRHITLWAPTTRSRSAAGRLLGRVPGAAAAASRALSLLPGASRVASTPQRLLCTISDRTGQRVSGLLDAPDRATFTAHAALKVACRVAGHALGHPEPLNRPGVHHAAGLLGADFILGLPGVKRVRLR